MGKWTVDPPNCEHKTSVFGLCLDCGTAARREEVVVKIGTHASLLVEIVSSRVFPLKEGEYALVQESEGGPPEWMFCHYVNGLGVPFFNR